MAGMARGIHQFIIKEVGQQNDWMHRNKQDQQGEEAELENCLERLKGENRPRCWCNRLVVTRVEYTKQGPGVHQPMRDIKVSVVEKHREKET